MRYESNLEPPVHHAGHINSKVHVFEGQTYADADAEGLW